jgi:hypothetical protein
MSVRVHIDRLVIDRATGADPDACAAAIRTALGRELARRAPGRARAIDRIDAGGGPATPEQVGAAAATALGRAIR